MSIQTRRGHFGSCPPSELDVEKWARSCECQEVVVFPGPLQFPNVPTRWQSTTLRLYAHLKYKIQAPFVSVFIRIRPLDFLEGFTGGVLKGIAGHSANFPAANKATFDFGTKVRKLLFSLGRGEGNVLIF